MATSITHAAVLVLLLSLISRVLGLVREMVIAWRFGASFETDAFFVAFTIPYAFFAVVGVSLTTVVVTLMAQYEAQPKRGEVSHTAALVINFVAVSIGTLAVIGTLAAPQISWFLGGGFDTATLDLVTEFTAMLMPSIIFMSVAGVLSGLLNSHHVFGAPAFGPVVMNIVIIIAAVIGGAWGGIHAIVVGTLIGGAAFVAVQLPALRRIGYQHRWRFDFQDPTISRIVALIWPVMLLSGLGVLYTAIDFRLASGMAEGSVTALNYATKLIQLPQAIFVMAVTTAIFPVLSRLAAVGRHEEMGVLLQKSLRVIFLLAVPSTVGLWLIGEPMISLLFERGAFDAKATITTSAALQYLTLGLVGLCLNLPLIRGFYALQDRRTPLLVSALSVVVKLFLSVMLINSMQQNGLALATSIMFLLNAAVLGFLLDKKLNGLFSSSFLSFAFRVLSASLLMGGAIRIAEWMFVSEVQHGSLALLWQIALEIGFGVSIFWALAWLYRIEEVRRLSVAISSRIRATVVA